MKMIKVFTVYAQAEKFALVVKGKIIVHYDWDTILNKIIEEYVVKY